MIVLFSLAHAQESAPSPAEPTPPHEPAPPAAAPAAPAAPAALAAPKPFPLSTTGEARLIGSLPPNFVADTEGQEVGQGFVLESRARVGLVWTGSDWHARTEWDLFSGQLAGDAWDLRGTEDARDRDVVGVFRRESYVPRRISVDGMAGPIAIEAGLVTSHWGLGMLANDGAHDPTFGHDRFGDRVIRLRLATRPVPSITLVAAGDRVIQDEQATWDLWDGGQAAWQVLGSGIWSSKTDERAGIYAVYRYQVEADGERTTRAGIFDGYFDWNENIGTHSLRVAGEVAGIVGHTDRGQSYNSRDGLIVQSFGATGLVAFSPPSKRATATFRGGYASGDGNPDDGYSRDFTFDRDFDVGQVMYDEVQGAIDAATYAQLSDPLHSGGAPDGAELIVAEGAFRRAVFFQPVADAHFIPWLNVRLGATFAWNTAPISAPFATYRNGGVPANHLGQPTSGYALGTELDWAVTLGDTKVKLGKIETTPALLVQGGHYLASDDMGGGTYSLVTATGRVRW